MNINWNNTLPRWMAIAVAWIGLGLGMACEQTKEGEMQQRPAGFRLEAGDILFQQLDCGPMCDAINRVTEGYNDYDFAHMGLVVEDSGRLGILEAYGDSVLITPMNEYLFRATDSLGNPRIMVARLKPDYRHLIEDAMKFGKSYIGEPYDREYLWDNGSYYCSELMYLAFHRANGDQPLFQLYPMTFKDPDTGEFFKPWVEHYEKLGIDIPEGEPGCNPGGISRSEALEMIHSFSPTLKLLQPESIQ
ncbi:YiiX/YebB-like N1pC/P60 family cysteine hydrolase [Pontibacter sp. G13]|uniref:YiiX/YebB-like N1pC/P60 family cysteine hydrolase n=1 Tax=Pontibacter sp. G13 TaxID=3074898 RepID=UPI00288A5237|nr:YiiX/YebB-like N1pC/P60 family cysteine hydrolase [Pontibacter sp. G13]WNJ17679.1 YiiX/YebB-like N1pC/P60 family cysteine hydrolase [Pontibacter sp. G13]